MDLTKDELPARVKVGGEWYDIKTDFRIWIDFARLLKDKSAKVEDFDFVYSNGSFNAPDDRVAGFEQLLKFYAPPRVLPRSDGRKHEDVIDYDLDGDLIYSAFMREYKIDLCDVKMHWHKFSALLAGLKDSKLTDVIGYRLWTNKTGKTDDYTKQMQSLQDAWQLETYETETEKKKELDEFERWLNGERK